MTLSLAGPIAASSGDLTGFIGVVRPPAAQQSAARGVLMSCPRGARDGADGRALTIMHSLLLPICLLMLGATSLPALAAPAAAPRLIVEPPRANLELERPPIQLRVLLKRGGTTRDVTADARFRAIGPAATVTGSGEVSAMTPGEAALRVTAHGLTAPAQVSVKRPERPPGFLQEVLPLLSKAGCSAAACHAKQGGQAGFQLSVLNYDPEADFSAILHQSGGRRINRVRPEESLLLRKATGALPHGGGRRLEPGSRQYRLLAAWLASGAPYSSGEAAGPGSIRITPASLSMSADGRAQLRVEALFPDGSRRDVTALSHWSSSEESVAAVDGSGRVAATPAVGEAALMARYMDQVAVARIVRPRGGASAAGLIADQPRQNFIDEHVYRKLADLNIPPSPQVDDAGFLRRVSLDLAGLLPEPAEVRAFLARSAELRRSHGSEGAQRARTEVIDALLASPEYGDYWATRWAGLLLIDRDPLFPKGAYAYDRWLRDSFRDNLPLDEFARRLVTAAGETYRTGPANFYRALATPPEQAKAISQLFLGVRLDCAQCHHHPSERWGQDDFYSFAAYFARVRRKGSREFEQVIFNAPSGEVEHPKSGLAMTPRPPGEPDAPAVTGERRAALAAWITDPSNPFFARAMVNRYWGLLMGPGIVEPVDDFRVTNPASNEPLLDALAKSFVAANFDVKKLLRAITASAAYQRSSEAAPGNSGDSRNYSRFQRRRLIAEVLLDAVSQVTGVEEAYRGHPPGTRAVQMWDNKLPVEFLDVFGRPARLSVCECDRPVDGSVTQLLHLMNSPAIHGRLTSDEGTAARLTREAGSIGEIVDDAFLLALGRPPRPSERAAGLAAMGRGKPRQAVEDLLWALINSPEFFHNH